MEVYENSFVEKEEFDFKNYLPYFKKLFERTRSKYETLMDPLSDKIQHLPESKQMKYNKLMVNIIAHLSVLSSMLEKDLNIPENDLKSDVDIIYVPNDV